MTLAALSSPAAAAAAADPITFVGTFYTESFSDEHEERSQLDLWRQGSHAFGLAAQTVGLIGDPSPTVERFDGSLEPAGGKLALTRAGRPFFEGVLAGDALTGSFQSEPEVLHVEVSDSRVARSLPRGEQKTLRRREDAFRTHAQAAPVSSFEAWTKWSDGVLAALEDPSVQHDRRACEQGDGGACLGLGNRGNIDGKPREARKYWTRACGLGSWAGCKFLGDRAAYDRILAKQCRADAQPSLERNFACAEWAQSAEKKGDLKQAKRRYGLGCNKFQLPNISCPRLAALRYSPGEQKQLRATCQKDDHVACFILGSLADKAGRSAEAEKLLRKACTGVAYACARLAEM